MEILGVFAVLAIIYFTLTTIFPAIFIGTSVIWAKISPFLFTPEFMIYVWIIPAIITLIGYAVKTVNDIEREKKLRDVQEDYYSPSLTVGTLIGRFIVSIIPIINVIVFIFCIFPSIFSGFTEFFTKLFNEPIVPKKKD